MIFNIIVDAVVRAVMMEVDPRRHNIVLYATDGRIAGRNPIWLQTTLFVREIGTPEKHRQDESNGIHIGVSLGPTGVCTVQEESDRKETLLGSVREPV